MTFIELLDHYHILYKQVGEHEHARNEWVQIECPHCSADSGRFRLGINLRSGHASCWSCGFKQIVSVLVEITGESYGRVKKLLQSIQKVPASTLQPFKPTGRLQVPKDLEALTGPFANYLAGRGFAVPKMKRLWALRGIGIAAHLSWRIYIPIIYRGETVSWTTRSIGLNGEPRYLSASPEQEKISHKTILYGSDYVRNAVVICEGPTDVWRIGPGAVATLGTSYSRSQMLAISQIPVRAICFDVEKAAQKRALRLVDELRCYPGQTMLIRLETANDVADANEEEVTTIRRDVLEN